MIPTILQIGPITISAFGVLTALGFFFGSFSAWKRGKEEHLEEDSLMDAILLVVLISLIFSRIWYVFLNWQKQILILDLINNPGFSWQGAGLAGLVSLAFVCQKRKWDFFKITDLSVFGLTLGLILGKLGVFLSQTSFEWVFLMETGLLILVYRLLLIFDKNYRTYEWYKDKRGEAKPGFLITSFLTMTTLIFLISKIIQSWPKFFTPEKIIDLFILILVLAVFYFRSGDRNLTINLPSFKKGRRVKQEKFRFKAGMEAK